MRHLPDSHTDFVLSIGVDKPGIVILCLSLLVVFALVLIRNRWRSGS